MDIKKNIDESKKKRIWIITVAASIVIVAIILIILLLRGCSNSKSFSVTWRNYDDTILKTAQVKDGDVPQYDGPEPAHSKVEGYIYTFNGWSPLPEPIHENTTYTAQFIEAKLKYLYKFTPSNYYNLVNEKDEPIPEQGVEYSYDTEAVYYITSKNIQAYALPSQNDITVDGADSFVYEKQENKIKITVKVKNAVTVTVKDPGTTKYKVTFNGNDKYKLTMLDTTEITSEGVDVAYTDKPIKFTITLLDSAKDEYELPLENEITHMGTTISGYQLNDNSVTFNAPITQITQFSANTTRKKQYKVEVNGTNCLIKYGDEDPKVSASAMVDYNSNTENFTISLDEEHATYTLPDSVNDLSIEGTTTDNVTYNKDNKTIQVNNVKSTVIIGIKAESPTPVEKVNFKFNCEGCDIYYKGEKVVQATGINVEPETEITCTIQASGTDNVVPTSYEQLSLDSGTTLTSDNYTYDSDSGIGTFTYTVTIADTLQYSQPTPPPVTSYNVAFASSDKYQLTNAEGEIITSENVDVVEAGVTPTYYLTSKDFSKYALPVKEEIAISTNSSFEYETDLENNQVKLTLTPTGNTTIGVKLKTAQVSFIFTGTNCGINIADVTKANSYQSLITKGSNLTFTITPDSGCNMPNDIDVYIGERKCTKGNDYTYTVDASSVATFTASNVNDRITCAAMARDPSLKATLVYDYKNDPNTSKKLTITSDTLKSASGLLIDWGDGSKTTSTSSNQITHPYANDLTNDYILINVNTTSGNQHLGAPYISNNTNYCSNLYIVRTYLYDNIIALYNIQTQYPGFAYVENLNTFESTAITSIGINSLVNCKYLTHLVIPASCTSIGKYAFKYNSASVVSSSCVTIPSTIDSMGEDVFGNWGSNQRIYVSYTKEVAQQKWGDEATWKGPSCNAQIIYLPS